MPLLKPPLKSVNDDRVSILDPWYAIEYNTSPYGLPLEAIQALLAYRANRAHPGAFIYGLLSNHLELAYKYGTPEEIKLIPNYLAALFYTMPIGLMGSMDAVYKHIHGKDRPR